MDYDIREHNIVRSMFDLIKRFSRIVLLLIICFGAQYSYIITAAHERIRVVIKEPVVDLNTYEPCPGNVPASPEVAGSCPRAHQELFNKIGYCCAGNCYSENKKEIITVKYPDVVYGFDEAAGEPRNTFCVYREYIEPCSEELLSALPNPVYGQEPTVVLTSPWQHFSVGTRFRRKRELDRDDVYAVIVMNYQNNVPEIAYIPMTSVLEEEISDAASARALFVQITNNFVDQVSSEVIEPGGMRVIPYVWGGSSFVNVYYDKTPDNNAFHLENGVAWQRDGERDPYTGYDCSELVMRMAKIAGIDFPWKTTDVQVSRMPALELGDELQEGDLIWVKGHVMIVSDIVNGELIEACGYSSGYGRVHRITLSKRFDGIESYADLLEKYYKKEPIRFKNRNGDSMGRLQDFKLLKLMD